ncbi:MAG: hypothetical protein LIP02_10090 [Bacteroidales bacterium]|nr:hypothetical protein [Bacteroidales bacterium]
MPTSYTINQPIGTIVEEYLAAKGTKINVLRKELNRRFDFVDWHDQLAILNAYLQAERKEDIIRLYIILHRGYWDTLNKIIKEYQDTSAKALKDSLQDYTLNHLSTQVIASFFTEYMPLSVVRQHEKTLSRYIDVDYWSLALRLAGDKNWKIDKERCVNLSYYTVLAKHHRTVAETEARQDLIDFILNQGLCLSQDESDTIGGEAFCMSLFDNQDIKGWEKDIRMLGLGDLADKVRKWDYSLQDRIHAIYRHDYAENPYPIVTPETRAYYREIFLSMAIEDITSSTHPDNRLDAFTNRNPDLAALVDRLQLSIDTPLPF